MKRGTFKIKPRKSLKRTPFKKTFKDGTFTKKYLVKSAITWHDKAWKKFSEYIRRKAKGVCFTCGAINRWQDCDAGHFKHSRLDFDNNNVHCQCQKCNRFLHGNLGNYALALMEEIGIDGVNQLNRDATLELGKYKSAEDYKIIHDFYDEELKKL